MIPNCVKRFIYCKVKGYWIWQTESSTVFSMTLYDVSKGINLMSIPGNNFIVSILLFIFLMIFIFLSFQIETYCEKSPFVPFVYDKEPTLTKFIQKPSKTLVNILNTEIPNTNWNYFPVGKYLFRVAKY